MSKTYYCTKCEQRHVKTGAIGKKHAEFKGEAPKVEPPAEPLTPDTGLMSATGANEDVITPPRPRQGCGTCNDTGIVIVGTSLRGDGREYQNTTYCKCGQETHDERIGLTPRRTGPDQPISDEDRAEANYRRSHGGTHDEYLALGTDGSGSQ